MTRSVEIPDAAVGAAAKAACEATYPPNPSGRVKVHDSWEEIEEWERDAWRTTARAALVAARPYLMPTAEAISETLQAHYPRTGMVVASGVTCECGYWNGTEGPGRDRPAGAQGRDGLNCIVLRSSRLFSQPVGTGNELRRTGPEHLRARRERVRQRPPVQV